MNLQQAQARFTELKARALSGDNLTAEETADLTIATIIIEALADTPAPIVPKTLAEAKEMMRTRGLLPKETFFTNPTVVLAGKVIGVLAVAGLSAFGGMKYEQRRQTRGRNAMIGNDQPDHSMSPQSHPATSPLDGRHFNHQGNPGNEGNTTNHPGPAAGRSSRSTATA